MMAVDTSVIIAISMNEPEADAFRPLMGRETVIIGWPTLLEARMVLTGKGFISAATMIKRLSETPNVITVAFEEKHFRAAEDAFTRFGRGRHPAALNMGDCFSYAVAAVAKAPLLFKGRDFSQTDLKLHPASSTT
ncbi:MAG: type II toxin-antitoxin system VapC family toxin [Rhizobiaceae bacterium]|nr:type II toxin-antitoxin system VapC family toxin [Rhizobiaceae bacterium]MBU3963651.1 type II toxin-antitoxin system VapC family toxin [Alphaproteobacteria bacterium]